MIRWFILSLKSAILRNLLLKSGFFLFRSDILKLSSAIIGISLSILGGITNDDIALVSYYPYLWSGWSIYGFVFISLEKLVCFLTIGEEFFFRIVGEVVFFSMIGDMSLFDEVFLRMLDCTIYKCELETYWGCNICNLD